MAGKQTNIPLMIENKTAGTIADSTEVALATFEGAGATKTIYDSFNDEAQVLLPGTELMTHTYYYVL